MLVAVHPGTLVTSAALLWRTLRQMARTAFSVQTGIGARMLRLLALLDLARTWKAGSGRYRVAAVKPLSGIVGGRGRGARDQVGQLLEVAVVDGQVGDLRLQDHLLHLRVGRVYPRRSSRLPAPATRGP